MKLSKVYSIIKREKELLIQDGINESQWVGTTNAIYQISGLPAFTPDNLFQLMGVAEDKKEKFTLYENGFNTSLDDMVSSEKDAFAGRVHIKSGDEEYIPVTTTEGLVFIEEKYLEPVYDMPQLRLYERKSIDGSLYIAVKSGMWIFALIEPKRLLSREAIIELENIAKCAKAKWNFYERTNEENEEHVS